MKKAIGCMRAAVIAIGMIAANAAHAQTSLETIRMALDASDFATIETEIDAMNEAAAKAGDYAALRNLYAVLFATAHHDRLEREAAWLAETPGSPYAASAIGWAHFRRAFLVRGVEVARYTSREASDAFRREISLATAAADRALAADPDFVPALDLSIRIARNNGRLADVPALFDMLASLAPDPTTLKNGIDAFSPKWGGSREGQFALCARLKGRIPGLDDEGCLIYIVFTEGYEGGVRKAAVAALETRDEDFLDFARADAYVSEWRGKPEAADFASRILMESLGPSVIIERFDERLNLISHLFKRPFFEIEARDAFLKTLKERRADSPQDHRVLRRLLDDIVKGPFPISAEDPSAEEATALWRDMLALGEYVPEVWMAGRRIQSLLSTADDPLASAPFYVNRIYYSNHSPSALRAYFVYLYGVLRHADTPGQAPDRAVLAVQGDDVVLCPMFRAQRLFEAVCNADPGQTGCNIAGADSNVEGDIHRLILRAEACEAERTAPVETLLFVPYPVSHFLRENDR